MWQQKVDKPKLQNNFLRPEVQEYKDAAPPLDNNNFKIAKQISYDFSSEFKEISPRQAGFIEECRIGDADLVEFREPNGLEAIEKISEHEESHEIMKMGVVKSDRSKKVKKQKSDLTIISKTDQGVSSRKDRQPSSSSRDEESGMESCKDDDISDEPVNVIKKTSFIDDGVN